MVPWKSTLLLAVPAHMNHAWIEFNSVLVQYNPPDESQNALQSIPSSKSIFEGINQSPQALDACATVTASARFDQILLTSLELHATIQARPPCFANKYPPSTKEPRAQHLNQEL